MYGPALFAERHREIMEVFVRRGDQWWIEAYHNVPRVEVR
jgi:hypothetical protein